MSGRQARPDPGRNRQKRPRERGRRMEDSEQVGWRAWTRRPALVSLDTLGAAVAFLAFGVAGGLVGIIAGVLVAGASLTLAAPVAIALGHVLLLGVQPTPTIAQVLAVELGFGLVLVGAGGEFGARRRIAGAMTLSFVGLLAVLGLAIESFDDLWLTCALLVAVIGLLGYGLYRYGLLELGLVEANS